MFFTTSATFTAALLTAAETQKQPKCPLMDERERKCVRTRARARTHTHTHTHTHTQWNIIQPKKSPAIRGNMDEPRGSYAVK